MPLRVLLALARPCTAALIVAVLAACGAASVAEHAEDLSAAGDVDGAVAELRRAVAMAQPGEKPAYERRLQLAVDHAFGRHVQVAEAALQAHDLAGAEAAVAKAAKYREDDDRLLGLQARVADVRSRGAKALVDSRARLQKLGEVPRPEDKPEWQALLADLEWLADWPRDFAQGAALREQVRERAVAFLLQDAVNLMAVEEFEAALGQVRRALQWAPGHPTAVKLELELQQVAEVEALARKANALLADRQFEEALALFLEASARNPRSYAATQGLAEARRQWQTVLAGQIREALAAKDLVRAVAQAAGLESLAAADAPLPDDLVKLARDVRRRAADVLRPQLRAAQARKLDGATLVYARLLHTLLPDDKALAKTLPKLEAAVAARASYRLALPVPDVPANAPTVVAQAVLARLVSRLEKVGLAQARVLLVGRGGRPKPDGGLDVTVGRFALQREQKPEKRSKPYLDRVEIVDNPAWDEAQGKQATTLGALNDASDQLRPVLEQVNRAEAALFKLQEQLLDIRKKITEEDAAWYKDKPSPCPDRTLACPQTRAHQRWQANVDYYEKSLAKENQKLETLAPEMRRLQAAVDAAQKAFDEAQRLAVETPKRVPREVWLPYEYEVARHDLALDAQLRVRWQDGGREAAAGEHALQETHTDFATPTVMVKGQVLEPAKALELPGDVTLVHDVVGRLLDVALPPVVAALHRHGDRFAQAASAATSDLERVHYLLLAVEAGQALSPETRAQAQAELLARTGYRAETGRLDREKFVVPGK